MTEREIACAWHDIEPHAWDALSEPYRAELVKQALDGRKRLEAAGYVIVPKEPTEAMLDNGYQFITRRLCEMGDKAELINLYRAMLAASKENADG